VVYDLAASKYEDLSIELVDENDGVAVTDEGLTVHGQLFALLIDDDLVVCLSPERTADLVARGIAVAHEGDWVRINDQQLWAELAREAHEFVGEPPVGGQS
jgi:hypothetical protein